MMEVIMSSDVSGMQKSSRHSKIKLKKKKGFKIRTLIS